MRIIIFSLITILLISLSCKRNQFEEINNDLFFIKIDDINISFLDYLEFYWFNSNDYIFPFADDNLKINLLIAYSLFAKQADKDELVDYCLNHFDTVIISSGMIDLERARGLMDRGAKVLYCVSKYPTYIYEIDFDKMQFMDGFSDHTIGIKSAKTAIELGVEYVERHYTLGKFLPGSDHFFSSTPDEFKELVEYCDYLQNCKMYKERWNNG